MKKAIDGLATSSDVKNVSDKIGAYTSNKGDTLKDAITHIDSELICSTE